MMTKRTKSRLRWRDGIASIGTTIVGNVSQGCWFGKSGYWFAYGAIEDWEDTPLGSFDSLQLSSWARSELVALARLILDKHDGGNEKKSGRK